LKSDAKTGFALRVFEKLTAAVFALTTLLAILSILIAAAGKNSSVTRDSIEYWASGQLLAHGENPYDTTAILHLERSVGLPGHMPALVMGNAPPALLLTYPLGLVGVRTAQRIWMLLLAVCLILSVRILAPPSGKSRPYIQMLAFGFAPALVCVAVGQMALLLLLGLALFLKFYRTRPLIAGASLWLCLLKPQLFLPFGLVLAVWIWRERQFKVFAGLAITLTASVLTMAWLDAACWSQYRAMMSLERYDRARIPCLTMVLRDVTGGGVAVQYAPAVIACFWALWYFWRHREEWDWRRHGSILMLVSLLVAPYSWLVDQCVAVPALIYGLQATRSRILVALLAGASVIIEVAPLFGRSLLHSNFYLWTSPAWLIWYIVATRSRRDFRPRSGVLDLQSCESLGVLEAT
jgi:hypothetical protein